MPLLDIATLLTRRERQILQLIAEGHTNPQIGAQLFLSIETIKTHAISLYAKLGANGRAQAVHHAHRLGILS